MKKKTIIPLAIVLAVVLIVLGVFCMVWIPTNTVTEVSLTNSEPYNYDLDEMMTEFGTGKTVAPIASVRDAKRVAWDAAVEKFGFRTVFTELPLRVLHDEAQEAWLVTGTLYFAENGGTVCVLIRKDGSVAVWHEK